MLDSHWPGCTWAVEGSEPPSPCRAGWGCLRCVSLSHALSPDHSVGSPISVVCCPPVLCLERCAFSSRLFWLRYRKLHWTKGDVAHLCVDKMSVVVTLLSRGWQRCGRSRACLVGWRVNDWCLAAEGLSGGFQAGRQVPSAGCFWGCQRIYVSYARVHKLRISFICAIYSVLKLSSEVL